MLKATMTFLLVSVLLFAVQACAPSFPSTPDPNAIDTAVAQTIAASLAQTQPGIPVTGPETATVAPTSSPQGPTLTAIVLPSSTPTITSTSAITGTQVTVSTPTNCRVGPGIAYERVGALELGEVAEVVDRNAVGTYWIIRNPDRPGQLCWLWGEFATVTGDTNALPVHTPPPTPTPLPTNTPSPSFAASYNGLESCTGVGWWVEIELNNTGGISFESLALTLRDTTNNTVFSLYADTFTDQNGCNATDTHGNLPSGSTRIVSSPVLNYDPTGRALPRHDHPVLQPWTKRHLHNTSHQFHTVV